MTTREIKESVEIDQFDLPFAQAWVESALEGGLIAKTGRLERVDSLQHHGRWAERGPRYHGRFAVSEQARGGEPSRRY